MWKIVDYFNGWEGNKAYSNVEEAMAEMENYKNEFYGCLQNVNCKFMKTVVPLEYQWYWDCRQNSFVWG